MCLPSHTRCHLVLKAVSLCKVEKNCNLTAHNEYVGRVPTTACVYNCLYTINIEKGLIANCADSYAEGGSHGVQLSPTGDGAGFAGRNKRVVTV